MPANKKQKDWVNLPIPKVFPQNYLSLVEQRGGSVPHVLRQAKLKPDFLTQPGTEVSLKDFHYLVNAVVESIGDDGIGLEAGYQLPPTAYGNFGYALLCSETLKQAVEVCERFWHLIARGIDVHTSTQNDEFIVELSLRIEADDPLRKLSLEGSVSSIYRGFQLLLNNNEANGELWFDFPDPHYKNPIIEKFGHIRYGMPATQFRFNKNQLDHKIEMANPTGFKFAIEQCEREDALSDFGSSQTVSRVRKEMVFGVDGYPDLEELSQKLNMTARTLRRKLEQEGSKYSTLLEQARRRDAVNLLDSPDLDIQKVAELLGYADPANFTRAFRNWTGQTPSQYRETRKK